jgi:hypothetical protein
MHHYYARVNSQSDHPHESPNKCEQTFIYFLNFFFFLKKKKVCTNIFALQNCITLLEFGKDLQTYLQLLLLY